MTARIARLLLTLLLVSFLTACGERQTGKAEEASLPATPLDFLPALKGDYFRLDSEIVGRPYHIFVRYPEGYEQSPEREYPVIYLLDGDSLFPILAANHLFLHYDDKIPEAIVVGIAYGGFDPATNWRDVDFSTKWAERARSGGVEDFHRFLERELLPAVETRYRVDATRRVLYGQSRGGFMVLYSAFNHPDLFWGRVAGNPSLLPDPEQFYAEPAKAARSDLRLVVSSATEDRYKENRERTLDWYSHWNARNNAPWNIYFNTIEGGTHAANSSDIYRLALRELFQEEIMQNQQEADVAAQH